MLRYVSQEQPRGRICRKEFIWEWRRRECGREEGEAANKRSINTKVTPVNNWSSIPLGNSGAERVEGAGSELFQARGRRAGRFTAGSPGRKAASRAVLSSAPPPAVWGQPRRFGGRGPPAKTCSLEQLKVGLACARDTSRAPTASGGDELHRKHSHLLSACSEQSPLC